MHLLTREVSFTRRSSRTHAVIFLIACAIFVLGNMAGFYRGLAVGTQQRESAPDVRTDDACGITDPLACAASLLESAAEAFRPQTYAPLAHWVEAGLTMPAYRVVVTEFSAVVCEDVERDYEACLADETCDAEKLGALAQDVLECMPPARL